MKKWSKWKRFKLWLVYKIIQSDDDILEDIDEWIMQDKTVEDILS